jgi:deazaflavin-dependent oxidoreductase (nitroreductase family)
MQEKALSIMMRWLVRLLSLIGTVWGLRILWVQYGQHSRTIRLFNRGILNPIALTFAGRAGVPYAVLYHVGRHSGQSYTTPLLVQSMKYGWVIPLTYGERADWYRNIKKAGGCTILWQGRRYPAKKAERMDATQAYPLFPPGLRLALRFAGIRQFVRLTSA